MAFYKENIDTPAVKREMPLCRFRVSKALRLCSFTLDNFEIDLALVGVSMADFR